MATMNDFTILCTEEQTKKALELGAPIEIADTLADLVNKTHFVLEDKLIIIPTAEQLIGWLEKDYFGSIEPCKYGDGSGEWGYRIFDKSMNCILYNNSKERQLQSRKEATLAAIDAALDYLLNNITK